MKDTFYFSHDYNTRQDIKVKKLLVKHGMCGYGVFWSIIEDLYNNANALPLDYESIAYDLRIDSEVIKSIINDFDLFVIDNDMFGSNSIQRRLEERESKSTNARKSALKRWNKSEGNADVMPTHSEGNAIKERKGDESKGKEKKVKDIKENMGGFKIKPEIQYELETLLFVFNEVFKTKYESIESLKINYAHWRQFYEPAQIEQAIINASKDSFWKGKITPVILFRQKNQNKESVDYIGDLLNRKPELTKKQEFLTPFAEALNNLR